MVYRFHQHPQDGLSALLQLVLHLWLLIMSNKNGPKQSVWIPGALLCHGLYDLLLRLGTSMEIHGNIEAPTL